MRIGWLLLIHSGRKGWVRQFLTALAVALGMVMVLIFSAGISALDARNHRSDWRLDLSKTVQSGKPVNGVAPLQTKIATDGNLNKWQNKEIYVVSVRATGASSPQIPGLSTPKEGEYYVSQGLREVMRTYPEAHLGERFGNKRIGVIPAPLSASPDALEIIRGMSSAEASGERVNNIYRFTNNHGVSLYEGIFGAILLFGAIILLFPIVLFISIATQLGSVQREKRYAALRLIGATRRQVRNIVALESLAAAAIGVLFGSLTYFALLPLMNGYRFEDMRFWNGELTVSFGNFVCIAGLTLIFCLLANWWGMRRVQVSPLGVARAQKNDKQPQRRRLVPLGLGLVFFGWLATTPGRTWFKNNVSDGGFPLLMLLLAIVMVLFGLLLAGPWLTQAIARRFSRSTRSVTTLLAAKRIAVHARQVFRSVGGVVLALFAASFYLTAMSGITGLGSKALQNNGYSQLKVNTALVMSPALPQGFATELENQPYVQSVATVNSINDQGTVMSCKTLAIYTIHTCSPNLGDEQKVRLNFEDAVVKDIARAPDDTGNSTAQYLVKLDTNDHIDQLRTLIAKTTGLGAASYVVSGTYAHIPLLNPTVKELASLAYAGMAVTLFVAIASLIVSTISGLLERQRSFATLRLGGMTVQQMGRTVMLESLVPLITVSLLASGLGVWIGQVFTSMLSENANPRPTPLYFAILAGSLIVASVSIRLILPLLNSITQPESNQTE